MPVIRYIEAAFSTVLRAAGYWLLVEKERSAAVSTNYLLYGEHAFGAEKAWVGLPVGVFSDLTAFSVRLWLRTTGSGVVLGYQTTPRIDSYRPAGGVPMLYVGKDGRLRAELWNGGVRPIASKDRVDDGRWHHIALVGGDSTQSLHVDGDLVGRLEGELLQRRLAYAQVGTGYARGWPGAEPGWFDFGGSVSDLVLEPAPLTAEQIEELASQGPGARIR
jgi:hypothetical protein